MKSSGPPKRRVLYSIAAVVVISGLMFGSSIYTKNTLNPNELVHFFIPFPAGRVVRPMTVPKPDGGAIFTRPVTLNMDQRGILKQIFQPGVEGLSTHWLTNVDKKSHRIGLKFTNLNNIPVKWSVGSAIPFDEQTYTFARALEPGESITDLGIDWLFFFPPEVRSKPVWYQGNLVVFDADTSENLTIIPIKFQTGGGK